MKRITFICLLLFFLVLLSSCSLPNRLPSSGVWYNEELDISIEFETENSSNYTYISNIIWNSKQEYLYAHIGYGNEFYFYAIDEKGTEIYLLEGHFKYSNNEFVIIASKIAQPFDIYGKLSVANDKTYTFTPLCTSFTKS